MIQLQTKALQQRSAKPAPGFTLIELVTTLILVSILAVWAVPKLGGVEVFKERNYFDQAVAAARYAQGVSRASQCPVNFRVALANGYRVRTASSEASCAAGPYTSRHVRPGGENNYVNDDVPSSITHISFTSIDFYPQGWACDSTGASDATVNINFTGETTIYTLIIECGTSYIRTETNPI